MNTPVGHDMEWQRFEMRLPFPLVVSMTLPTVKSDISLPKYVQAIQRALDEFFSTATRPFGIQESPVVIIHFQIMPPAAFYHRISLLVDQQKPMEIDWIDGSRVPFAATVPMELSLCYFEDPEELVRKCFPPLLAYSDATSNDKEDFYDNVMNYLENQEKRNRTRKYIPLVEDDDLILI